MTARALPARPNLDQLKRQAKELLRQQPQVGRLRDAQRTLAGEYGFASWDALRAARARHESRRDEPAAADPASPHLPPA